MNNKIKWLTKGSIIAALYVVMTFLSSIFGLASGPVQLRLSEMLCVLPMLSSSAIPGLYFGCLISNIFFGSTAIDVFLGSFATLIGAVGTYYLKSGNPILRSIPSILSNSFIVPIVIIKAYHVEIPFSLVFLSVFISEVLSCGVLGMLMYSLIKKNKLIDIIKD